GDPPKYLLTETRNVFYMVWDSVEVYELGALSTRDVLSLPGCPSLLALLLPPLVLGALQKCATVTSLRKKFDEALKVE
ncbi:hypothetical protein DV515_00013441, partial [Chloebia gouldiae]